MFGRNMLQGTKCSDPKLTAIASGIRIDWVVHAHRRTSSWRQCHEPYATAWDKCSECKIYTTDKCCIARGPAGVCGQRSPKRVGQVRRRRRRPVETFWCMCARRQMADRLAGVPRSWRTLRTVTTHIAVVSLSPRVSRCVRLWPGITHAHDRMVRVHGASPVRRLSTVRCDYRFKIVCLRGIKYSLTVLV